MKRVAILGSTGSIGTTTIRVIQQHRKEFKLEALAVKKNIGVLKEQIRKFRPSKVAVFDECSGKSLRSDICGKLNIYSGLEGLNRIASDDSIDIVVVALSGAVALFPLLAAIKAGKHIAIANKEAFVMAGAIIIRELRKSSAKLIPIDSEQSAIFQCLKDSGSLELHRLYLTASGGALCDVPFRDFKYLKQEKILSHPRWKMGKKITVDSATLMNKGLEVIEARWFFDVEVSNIKVLIHRQAIIHSMVEFVDGVVLAQLGVTDMALPIQYALSYPRRLLNERYRLDFLKIGNLTFEKPDVKKFPCLDFAYQAARFGGSAPCAMNAANEEAVNAFLEDRISFISIPKVIEKIMRKHKVVQTQSLGEVLETDRWARNQAQEIISKLSS